MPDEHVYDISTVALVEPVAPETDWVSDVPPLVKASLACDSVPLLHFRFTLYGPAV